MKYHKLQETKTGQLFLTIPRGIAQALGFKKGDKIKFLITGHGKLELDKKAGL